MGQLEMDNKSLKKEKAQKTFFGFNEYTILNLFKSQ